MIPSTHDPVDPTTSSRVAPIEEVGSAGLNTKWEYYPPKNLMRYLHQFEDSEHIEGLTPEQIIYAKRIKVAVDYLSQICTLLKKPTNQEYIESKILKKELKKVKAELEVLKGSRAFKKVRHQIEAEVEKSGEVKGGHLFERELLTKCRRQFQHFDLVGRSVGKIFEATQDFSLIQTIIKYHSTIDFVGINGTSLTFIEAKTGGSTLRKKQQKLVDEIFNRGHKVVLARKHDLNIYYQKTYMGGGLWGEQEINHLVEEGTV